MDINKQLTDLERVELTKKAYDELKLGEQIVVNDHLIGTVVEAIYAQDGMRAFVITNQTEVTILYKGSYGISRGNPTTWRDEWLRTNLPILVALLVNERRVPSQLKSATQVLNKTLKKYPYAHFYLYGHSLGSINAQYALANCHHPQQIAGAYLYEGTNIWLLLDQKQRKIVNKLRPKINNYVDIYDPVTLGITASHHMVGKLCYVDSEPMPPIKQHMWGGYQFDKEGKLKLREVDAAFLEESMSERKLLKRSNDLAKTIETMGQRYQVKELVTKKRLALQHRLPDHESWNKLTEIFDKIGYLKDRDN